MSLLATEQAKGITRSVSRDVVVSCLLGVLVGTFLEVLTLFGAPASSPLSLSDWNVRRLCVVCLGTSALALCCLRGWVKIRWRLLAVVLVLVLASLLGAAACRALSLVAPVGFRVLLCTAAFVAVVFSLVALRKRIVESPQKGFLIVAIPLGVAICLLMPPSASMCWDGTIHFDTAQAISYLFDAQYTGADARMATLGGLDVEDTYGTYAQMPIFPSTPQQGALEDATLSIPQVGDESVARAAAVLRDAEESEAITFLRGTHRLNGPSYVLAASWGNVPNAIGLWVGRLLRLSPYLRYALARIANMTFYVVVLYGAMRQLRRGKLIVAAIAFVPLFFLLSASFSYDPWCMCLMTYAIARFVGEMQRPDEVLDFRGVLGVVIPFMLGCMVRAVLVPLALIFLAMPLTKFEDKHHRLLYRIAVLATIAGLLLTFVVPFVFGVSAGTASGDQRGGSDVNAGRQAMLVLSNMGDYVLIAARFTLEFLSPTNLFHALYYYAHLVPLDSALGWVVTVGTLAMLVATTVADVVGASDERFPAASLRVLTFGTVFASYALVVSALYVSYTPVGLQTINGVQYRYMAALYAPCALLLCNGAFGLQRRPLCYAKKSLPFFLAESALLVLTALDVLVVRI